jgi:hypothetical protein
MGFRDAQIARQNAQDSAKQSARETYLRTGSMVASHGASGGRDGSFLDVLGDAAAQGELERQHIIYAGSVASDRLAHGAGLSEAQAGSELVGGALRASGALLRGMGKNSGGATIPNYSNYGASPEE